VCVCLCVCVFVRCVCVCGCCLFSVFRQRGGGVAGVLLSALWFLFGGGVFFFCVVCFYLWGFCVLFCDL